MSNQQRESQVNLHELDRQIQESQQAQGQLAQLQPELTEALSCLELGTFAVTEHSRLHELDQQIASLGYDDAARRQCYAAAQELQVFEERQLQLTLAAKGLPKKRQHFPRPRTCDCGGKTT